MSRRRMRIQRLLSLGAMLVLATTARAAPFLTYVTGDTPGGDVIFKVLLDPTIAGSAVVSVAVTDTRRLDGIDFLPGSTTRVSVGAQLGAGGAIAQFDVSTGAALGDFVAATGVDTVPSGTQPSTVLNHGGYVYYIENQFGFGGGGHRIMRTPIAGPPDTTEVVFTPPPSPLPPGLANFEGLEIHDGRLYFFSADPAAPGTRALFSFKLDPTGISDGSAPIKHLGGLAGSPDGADELDRDPLTGYIFGTNIVTGEVVYWDPSTVTGGTLISVAEITAAPLGSDINRFDTAMFDGIRATGDGYLVLTGLDGVIASIDIVGALAGLDASDVKLLFDGKGFSAAPSLAFDDLTPLLAIPAPGSLALILGGLVPFAAAMVRRRTGLRPASG